MNLNFPKGTVIVGKWNKRKYLIERRLGEGANGVVYLVRHGRKWFALKMGFSPIDHQSEVNALQSLHPGKNNQPYLLDVDDFTYHDKDIPFYVMRYVKGVNIQKFLSRNGYDWFFLIGYQLLRKLKVLHDQGWVFGDIKADNILVSGYGEVELIDFGGMSRKGNAVKQFTEIYDRGYWGAGSRTADEQYDLFAFAVLCIQCADQENKFPVSLYPQQREIGVLKQLIQSNPICRQIAPFLYKALQGKLKSTDEAIEMWRTMMHQVKGRMLPPIQLPWLKGALIASICVCVTSIILTWF